MLLGTLGASLLGNLLTGKGAFHARKRVKSKEQIKKVEECIELVKEL